MTGAAMLAALLTFSACSESPAPTEAKKKTEPAKPAVPTGPIPALQAYYECYKVARQIAPDIQVASVTGNEVEGTPSDKGKYAQWTVVFVSASKKEATTFVYTTVEHAGMLKGINNTGSQRWAGPRQDAMPFANGDFSVDSDAAYTAAATKGSAWMAKNADKPVTTFALGLSSRLTAPTWYIMWGDKKSGFAAFVNAVTGTVK
jgi:hypothetical protein